MSKLRYFLPSIGYYGLIYLLSAQPNVRIPLDFPLSDKILHFVLYTGFGLCLMFGITRVDFGRKFLRLVVFLGLGIAASALDEVHQLFVPGRFADPADAAFDVLGVLVGWMIVCWLARLPAGRRWFPPTPRS